MDSRFVLPWALAWGLLVAGVYAEESDTGTKKNLPAASASDDVGPLLDRLERLSARLGEVANEGSQEERLEVTRQCRELLSALRELLPHQSVSSRPVVKLPQALEAIREVACEGDHCQIDGKLVKNQDLQNATVGELFARLRDVQITDEERAELENEEGDEEVRLVGRFVVEDGQERQVLEVQTRKKPDQGDAQLPLADAPNTQNDEDEEQRFQKSKQRLEAAQKRRMKRELDEFSQSIAAQVQEIQRVYVPARGAERLRDLAGAIREKAADVVEKDAERAFDMLRQAERIEAQARKIAERSGDERRSARLQRGERDEPPMRPQPGMAPSGMMGPPPGARTDGAAGIPQDARGKAMMAQRLLMAAGLKKEAGIVAEAIEREFTVDPATVQRLRAEIAELQAANAQLKAALQNREAALREQIQARRKEAMDDEDEEEDDDDDSEEDEEDEDEDEDEAERDD